MRGSDARRRGGATIGLSASARTDQQGTGCLLGWKWTALLGDTERRVRAWVGKLGLWGGDLRRGGCRLTAVNLTDERAGVKSGAGWRWGG